MVSSREEVEAIAILSLQPNVQAVLAEIMDSCNHVVELVDVIEVSRINLLAAIPTLIDDSKDDYVLDSSQPRTVVVAKDYGECSDKF